MSQSTEMLRRNESEVNYSLQAALTCQAYVQCVYHQLLECPVGFVTEAK